MKIWTRDELLSEMVKVANALERPGLKPEQIERGKSRYAELETLLEETKAREIEQEKSDPSYSHRERIRGILGINSK
jgi:hypothetical protein